MNTARKPYPSDVSDTEWEFLLPYLSLMRENAPQREHPLRDVFNALRYVVKTGCHWRYLPHEFPPWAAVYQQARRWLAAGVFEQIADDLREAARLLQDKERQPSAIILDARTLQSTPESGGRAGYDGHKKKNGSKVHIAVDTLGYLLCVKVTAANEQERAQAGELAREVQEVTGHHVKIAYADQGYTGKSTRQQVAAEDIELIVVQRPASKPGFILLPHRWVVERTFGWLGRFRRLARDFERLSETLAGWHWVAAITLMLRHVLVEST